ncbi:aromatic ring-hydroxylating oxygenase subunit alpha [Herbaspirillum autotrophicum]|uniref:aromatic ring-hydroxylating oxygenase subunit alpha n=1 Tax=Herbaspirillum autotrophicum TaxID=180195 RepID=UPI0009FA6D5A|nr:aromatic ring-hydroxylating dioxygenase subunit alpha [Herbaspirillum autotrophicum]
MSEWLPSIYGKWFVAARSENVRQRPLAVTVLRQALVLGRMADGSVFAMEDRCPHRQAALSDGCITSHGIQCPYHGWTFDGDGKCSNIPGLAPAATLPVVRVRTVALREMNGLIWVRLAAGGDAEPPEVMSAAIPDAAQFFWQTRWQAPVVDAIENFLDPLHTHTVHPGLVRCDGVRKPIQVSLRRTPDGFIVNYLGQTEQSGLLYRLFESPRISERAIFAGAGSARIEYRYQNGSAIHITLHFTPASHEQTHVFTSLHIEKRWAPAWAVRLLVFPFLKKVARQDQRILEAQARNKSRFPPTRGASTMLDFVRPHLEKIWDNEDIPEHKLADKDFTICL